MKLCQFGPPGSEKPGIVTEAGVVDVSSHRGCWLPEDLSPAGLAAIADLKLSRLPIVEPERMGVPWNGISKYVCIGLNYSDHALEAGLDIPSEPIVFLKAPSAVCGPDDPTPMPMGGSKLDWEVELGVVIGTLARNVSKAEALNHVAGYCVLNDVSERAFQFQSGQWSKGKSFDGFGPIGPWLVTAEEISDPQKLGMTLDVNGKRMQTGSTSTMIFSVAEIVSYLSRYMTLLPGDVIATGTPPGVGMGSKPEPVYLKIGDKVTLAIEGLGCQSQEIIA
ncbi:fumarylacetoacetate hydrolase family protein [Brucella intermedia GD04153]|uniref:Fumarylacetoacetate hydrolase family protein n=1 Tax=Brucella intermedia GD04153 TaxID=2975438 RepID=A0AA42KMN2_9HYPH|nr:fumarylacetoacetate hydrolase family protein [Brucella intermedia]MDH0127103.1 fumarylacetoacetate hydrolase family protein [Brucella intermedia GD04153]RRD21403.1 FAA hydrolase family protein [Brucellaceae bacterium VT-16-1752]